MTWLIVGGVVVGVLAIVGIVWLLRVATEYIMDADHWKDH